MIGIVNKIKEDSEIKIDERDLFKMIFDPTQYDEERANSWSKNQTVNWIKNIGISDRLLFDPNFRNFKKCRIFFWDRIRIQIELSSYSKSSFLQAYSYNRREKL